MNHSDSSVRWISGSQVNIRHEQLEGANGSITQQHTDLRLHSVWRVRSRPGAEYSGSTWTSSDFHLAFDARLQSGERWVGVSPPNGTAVLTLVQPQNPDSWKAS